MSIRVRTVLRLYCDRCQLPLRDIVDPSAEVRLRIPEHDLPESAAGAFLSIGTDAGWLFRDGRHFCPDCARGMPR